MSDVSSTQEQLHAMIDGHVQGVSFRYFVAQHARSLCLTGWVRNTRDGQVEVTAEGKKSDLEILLGQLHSGPGNSYVASVKFDWLPATGNFTSFSITHSF